MKKLSPFILLLIPVFLGAAFILWNPNTQMRAKKYKVSHSFRTSLLIDAIKTAF